MTNPVTFVCDGGLDLLTPPVMATPGTLIDCLNYEVALRRGYKLKDGHQRYDGGPVAAADRFTALQTCVQLTGGINPCLPWKGNASGIISTPIAPSDYIGKVLAIVPASVPSWSSTPNDFTATATGEPELAIVFYANDLEAPFNPTVQMYVSSDTTVSSGNVGMVFSDFETYDNWRRTKYPTIDNTAGAIFISQINSNNYPEVGVAPTTFTSILNTSNSPISSKAAMDSAYNGGISDGIQPVPGQGPVHGLFWFEGYLYAIRDYYTFAFDTGVSQPLPGDVLTYTVGGGLTIAFYMKVVSVKTTSGDWGAGTAAGTITVGAINPSSSFTTKIGSISVGGSGAFTVYRIVSGSNVASFNTTSSFDAANMPAATSAGLYKATGGRAAQNPSWESVDLGWLVNFKNGVSPFTSRQVVGDTTPAIMTTVWHSPSADPDAPDKVAGYLWGALPSGSVISADVADPSDADASYASVLRDTGGAGANTAGTMGAFAVAGFGFTADEVPAGSTIVGIEIEVTRRTNQAGGTSTYTVTDKNMKLLGVTGTPTYFDSTDAWPVGLSNDPTSYVAKTYGSSSSFPGLTALSWNDITSSSFGVQVGATLASVSGTGGVQARVTGVRIRAYYTLPDDRIYFWNTATSTAISTSIHVINSTTTSGGTSGGNAAGTLDASSGTDLSVVGDGWQIRTWPVTGTPAGDGDGSIVIAVTDGSPTRQAFPTYSALSSADRYLKYEFITSNFYARRGLDAVYFCNGLGPAMMFDGEHFCRIWTGLTSDREKPLHVCDHQGHLCLGYEAGTVEASVPGNPLSFDGAAGAMELGFGATVVGLCSTNGDSLVVFTDHDIQMIQGKLDSGPYQSIISSDLAAIEYTIQPSVQFVFTSAVGIHNLQSVQAYGDFKPSSTSENIWPFLKDRVAAKVIEKNEPIGIIGSYTVRGKGQYRLLFNDGYQLTTTYISDSEPPQYTLQKFNSLPMNVVCNATDENGKDRIFASSNANPGFVYELDCGHSADGQPINGYFDLSIADQKTPWQGHRYSDMAVYGQAVDYADFNVYRSGSYTQIDLTNPIAHKFGDNAATKTDNNGLMLPYASFASVQIEGRGVNLRFSHNESQQPHTIQAITLQAGDLGSKRG